MRFKQISNKLITAQFPYIPTRWVLDSYLIIKNWKIELLKKEAYSKNNWEEIRNKFVITTVFLFKLNFTRVRVQPWTGFDNSDWDWIANAYKIRDWTLAHQQKRCYTIGISEWSRWSGCSPIQFTTIGWPLWNHGVRSSSRSEQILDIWKGMLERKLHAVGTD